MSPRRQCRSRTRTYFSLVGELSPGPPLLACLGFTNVASPSAFWILCVLPCFASRACPVKAIGLPFHLRDGDDGIRTHDPLLAGQVLSQLSYTPILSDKVFPRSLKTEQQNPSTRSVCASPLVFPLLQLRSARDCRSLSP